MSKEVSEAKEYLKKLSKETARSRILYEHHIAIETILQDHAILQEEAKEWEEYKKARKYQFEVSKTKIDEAKRNIEELKKTLYVSIYKNHIGDLNVVLIELDRLQEENTALQNENQAFCLANSEIDKLQKVIQEMAWQLSLTNKFWHKKIGNSKVENIIQYFENKAKESE